MAFSFTEGLTEEVMKKVFPLLVYYILLGRNCFDALGISFPFEYKKVGKMNNIEKLTLAFIMTISLCFSYEAIPQAEQFVTQTVRRNRKSALHKLLHSVLCLNPLTLGAKTDSEKGYKGNLEMLNFCIELSEKYLAVADFQNRRAMEFVRGTLICASERVLLALHLKDASPFPPIDYVYHSLYNLYLTFNRVAPTELIRNLRMHRSCGRARILSSRQIKSVVD